MTAAAWHPDPTGKHELRYWDGNQWTDHVSNKGVVATSSLATDNAVAAGGGAHTSASTDSADSGSTGMGADAASHTPGSDGSDGSDAMAVEESADAAPDDLTQMARPSSEQPSSEQPSAEQPMAAEPAPTPYQQQPAQQAPYQQQAAPQQAPYQQAAPQQAPHVQTMGQQVYGDAFAGISGDLIDGRFSEVDGVGAQLQNHKLLRIRVAEPFMAKQGSMVAYQGNVNFAYQGGGAAKFLKKALSGEGLSLMRVEGQGDVFLADLAHDVHILHLNNGGLSVNGKNVLAFSAALDWNVERVKGGSIAAGGLFNTTLRGTGWVAITTEGAPVVLNAQDAPTFADAQALVAWSVQLQTSIKSTMSAGALIGRGSGEAFQVAFSGPGFVIVQPSEGPPMQTSG